MEIYWRLVHTASDRTRMFASPPEVIIPIESYDGFGRSNYARKSVCISACFGITDHFLAGDRAGCLPFLCSATGRHGRRTNRRPSCLLYTSDAADDLLC